MEGVKRAKVNNGGEAFRSLDETVWKQIYAFSGPFKVHSAEEADLLEKILVSPPIFCYECESIDKEMHRLGEILFEQHPDFYHCARCEKYKHIDSMVVKGCRDPALCLRCERTPPNGVSVGLHLQKSKLCKCAEKKQKLERFCNKWDFEHCDTCASYYYETDGIRNRCGSCWEKQGVYNWENPDSDDSSDYSSEDE
jgi:hypothetical protein